LIVVLAIPSSSRCYGVQAEHQREAAQRRRAVALTGWGHPQDKQRALDAGFDSHLAKPIDPALSGAARHQPLERTADHLTV
jgi:CheY-like chemotaxis protein